MLIWLINLNIRLLCSHQGILYKDKLRWKLEKNGIFIVKSLYAKLLEPRNANVNTVRRKKFWKNLWNLNVSQRIKLSIWKCLNNALATRQNFSFIMRGIDSSCPFCGSAVESLTHIFFDCSFAKSVWALPPVPNISNCIVVTLF